MRGGAFLMLPTGVHYRRDAVESGLRACGYELHIEPKPKRGNVLVLWNRYPAAAQIARGYEANGGRVLVMENGYIGVDGNGHQLYAMALGHHLGAGSWPVGLQDRWSQLWGVRMQPWRPDPGPGGHILVLAQRGIGEPGVAMPRGWERDVCARLSQKTRRPVRLRLHPGKDKTPLDPDLRGCWAAVTWASGAGIKAIVAGVPVFYELPQWIGGLAAKPGLEELEEPFTGDRLPMLRRLAWAQWSLKEIMSGEAFAWLLK